MALLAGFGVLASPGGEKLAGEGFVGHQERFAKPTSATEEEQFKGQGECPIQYTICPSSPIPGGSSSGWYDKALEAQRGGAGPGPSQRWSEAPDFNHSVAGPKAQRAEP